MLLSQDGNVAMFNKLVGPANSHHRSVDHLRMEMFHHSATETVVEDVILERANHLHTAGKKFQCADIERFDPTRVDECHGDAAGFELLPCFLRHLKHVAEPEDGYVF